jgi:hypothetical protein
MKRLTGTAAVVVTALAASACGSGRHVTFKTYSPVCGLSVPAPPGFHRHFWSDSGGGGVTISDAAIGVGDPAEWSEGSFPEKPNRVAVSVFQGFFHDPVRANLQIPVTLHELERASGGLTEWGGAFRVGNQVCGVAVWLGPDASAADHSAALSALQAVKKLR